MTAASVSHEQLSEAADYGQPIYVTSTAAEDIHVTGSGTTDADELFLWALNYGTSDASIIIEVEHSGAGVNFIGGGIVPANSPPLLMVPGLRFANTATITAKAASGTISVAILGYVNRITNDPSA